MNKAKWILNTESDFIGIEEEKYTQDLIDTNKINLEIPEMNIYYLHVLTQDKNGSKKETIKGPIEITPTYHQHKDANGIVRSASWTSGNSSTAGSATGCFTTGNIIYTTTTGSCGGTIYYTGTGVVLDGQAVTFKSCQRCGASHGYSSGTGHSGPAGTCNRTVNKTVDSGKRYYSLGCGKTDTTIEAYEIIF